MNEHDNQSPIAPAFLALYWPQGRRHSLADRATVASRYELCEDMAQMLTEHALNKRFELGVGESDVLERIHLGLQAPDSGLAANEAQWVVQRLAELLEWPQPVPIAFG